MRYLPAVPSKFLYVPNSKPSNEILFCMLEQLMLQLGLSVSSMLGGLFSRGVDYAPHSRENGWTCHILHTVSKIVQNWHGCLPWAWPPTCKLGVISRVHKNNTMEILLKTASVRVSSIQNMQIRVQNKGKRVWKSRYNDDIPHASCVLPCYNCGWRKYALEAIIKLLFISLFRDKCLLFMLELY